MDMAGYSNESYLARYYAGQAMSGLLANGTLNYFLEPSSLKDSDDGIQKVVALAVNVGNEMAKQAMKV